MDLVEGATISKVVTHGRMMNEDHSFIYIPEELYKRATRPFSLAVETAKNLFSLQNLDGVIFGNNIRRFPEIKYCHFGVLLIWPISDRKKYLTFEEF